MKTMKFKRAMLVLTLLVMTLSAVTGGTIAWFTDSVNSENNIIKAGTLDIELSYKGKNDTEWKDASKGAIFNYDLWEPGYTDVKAVKVANVGTLALKFELNIKPDAAVTGDYKLADVIDVYVGEGALPTSLTEVQSGHLAGTISQLMADDQGAAHGELAAGIEDEMWIALHMQESAGNEYQNLSVGNGFTLQLMATQLTAEMDSFDNQYDADAGYGVDNWSGNVDTNLDDNVQKDEAGNEYILITTAEELAGIAKLVNSGAETFKGKTIKLGNNIDLNNAAWTPIGNADNGFNGTFDGQGYTISNFYVKQKTSAGLFGYALNGGNVKNLNAKNAVIEANDYAGAIMGRGYTDIVNCHVENITVTVTPYLMDNGMYDGGAKAGGVIGQLLEGTGNTVVGCSAKNVNITGYRDLGGVAGMLHNNNSMSDCSAENVAIRFVTVSVNQYDDGETDNENYGLVYGRKQASATVEGVSNNELGYVPTVEIQTAEELATLADMVNNGGNFAKQTVTLAKDIDLQNKEWTPIGATNGFNGIFDGQDHTIKNLKITGRKSTVGLFGNTYNGEIKNLTVENAQVSGRLNVGVVAGNPYTSKYTNIKVTGLVQVEGMAYVGGVGGKNAYANWTDITVDASEGSYVKADSVENGVAYRTYVGGVIGFMGEGNHSFTKVTSNIDVTGSTIDVGGITGIAHYGNSFIDCSSSGNVTVTNAAEAADAEEIGGIAGVWHNQNGTKVTFDGCSYTGTLKANITEGVDLSDNTIVGKAYSASGTGELIVK